MWELVLLIGIMVVALLFLLTYRQEQRQNRRFTDTLRASELGAAQLREKMKDLTSQLQHATLDSVTGLMDRSHFLDRVKLALKESERYQLIAGVLFLTPDEFKVINDALSYEAGDQLLKAIAQRLEKCIRQVDSITRFSNETFAVLLMQLAKPETAAIVAQRMLQEVAKPFYIDNQELYLTACIGIAIYPSDGKDSSALFRVVDSALQLAKQKGKQHYQFSQERIHQDSKRELAMHTAINRETLYQELVTYYQPIVDVSTNTVICMDAKLAWQHAELGLIEQAEFLTYAARQRKLNQLTEWLLKKTAKQFNRWHAAGFTPTLLSIPVTLSQLENSQFIYNLSQIMSQTGFKPESLLLDIKGGDKSPSFELLEKSLNMLNYLGVKLTLDNIGMDGFSVAELKLLTVHYLKLDRSLVDDIVINDRTQALVKSLAYLANTLSMRLIAESVASEEQKQLLQKLGCTLMQGSLLGAPLQEQEVLAKMMVTTH